MKKKVNKKVERSARIYLVGNDTPFLIMEQYRSAVTNLRFALSVSSNNIVAFTSCSPHEGKSTTAVNTAVVLAELGSSVLLVDTDFRKSSFGKFFPQKTKVGLTSFLSGFCSYSEAVYKNAFQNLDVIACGAVPPNPTELLASDSMREFLEVVSQQYDYVLIDTPPINVVSDALLLTPLIAGYIFIVKERMTTHPGIKEALKRIELANGKVLGFIKTDCNPEENKKYIKKYYQGGSYYKGYYNYSYGEKNNKESLLNFGDDFPSYGKSNNDKNK